MNKKRLLISLLGVILFVVILVRVDVGAVLSAVAAVNPWYLTATVLLTIPMMFLKSWRWRRLLRMQGMHYGARDAFLAYLSSSYLGLVTPGKVGDLSRVFYVRNDVGSSIGTAFSSVLVDRLFDLYVLVIVAGYGLLTLSLLEESVALSAVILALLLILPALIFSRGVGKGLIRLAYRSRILGRFEGTVDASADEFYSGVDMLARPRLVLPAVITLAAYAIYFAQYYLLASSLDLPLPFLDLAVYMAVSSLVELIPVSIAGLGTRDALLIALFSLHDISTESALSYSLLVLFAFYIFPAVVGAIAWQIKPIQLRGSQPTQDAQE